MKHIICVVLGFVFAGCQEPATPPTVNTWESQSHYQRVDLVGHNEQGINGPSERFDIAFLNEHGVTGQTGRRLGEICHLTATIERDEFPDDGGYVLRVSAINKLPLSKPIDFSFELASQARHGLVYDNFDLYELKKGKNARALDENEIKELERGYVGSRVLLIGFETGRFDGLPISPIQRPIGEIEPLRFSTSLIILDYKRLNTE